MATKEKRGNQQIKRIRKELGITQAELSFHGMTKSVIAKLESGERELNPKQASMLATRFEEFGYIVSAKVLMGQDKDVVEILRLIGNNINEKKLKQIDTLLLELENDKAVELILGIIQILKSDVDLYAKYILKYILKINEFNISKEIYIKTSLDLMGIYEILHNFNSVLIVASAINIYVDTFNRHDTFKYYYNLANANYKLKQYSKAKEHLKIAKKFAESKYKLNILTLEGNILVMQKKFVEAITINKKIIGEAKILKLYDYTANSKSNIAYMLMELKKNDEAKQYIDEAMDYINDISDLNKFNVIINKFYLELNINALTLDSFKKLISLSVKLNDKIRRDENIEFFIDNYIKNNKEPKKFLEIFDFLSSKNIIVDSNLKLKVIRYICNSFTNFDFKGFLEKIIAY